MKNNWLSELSRNGYKYFVLKASDLFLCLTEEEVKVFNNFLERYNKFREPKPINSYWILNRDDYKYKTFEEVHNALMAYNKFSINETVKVKDCLELGKNYYMNDKFYGTYINNSMKDMEGTNHVITEVTKQGYYLDDLVWLWTDEMLEKV